LRNIGRISAYYILIPVSGQKGRQRSLWSVLLKNPQTAGDPFVFGRGGEEAEALADAGVPFEIIPGVSSAVAVPAYAGIPLTHRDYASSFAVVTGHEAIKSKSTVDWAKLATAVDTLVILMGLHNLPAIVAKLLAHGRSPNTPVAVIRQGTTQQQATVTGTLADIVERSIAIKAPALIVVGVLMVGILSEDHVPGASVGELANTIIADQFQRLRDGDRFWYQRQFSGSALRTLEQTTLAKIIARNTNTTNLQDNAFFFKADSVGRH
jgi:precorrin-6B methylase 1